MSRQVVIPQISDNGESNMKSNSPGNRNQVFESNDIESEAGMKKHQITTFNRNTKEEIELKDFLKDLGFQDSTQIKPENDLKFNMFSRHKWKFLLFLILVFLVSILVAFLRIVSQSSSSSNGSVRVSSSPSLSAQLSASKGTSIPMVSIIPSKSSSEVGRRLDAMRLLANDLVVFPRRLSSTANPPSSFDELSDYNLMADPSYLVGDRSTEVVSTINLISCMSSQLRIKDVGLNTSFNPSLKPYAAVVDVSKCSSDQQEIMTWYVNSDGPDGMGDGKYKSNMIFRGFGSEIHITLKNTITDGVLRHSSFAFQSAQGENKGILIIDNTANETDITFFQEMFSMSQFMHVRFNPQTFIGKAITKSPDSGRYALDFDYDAINRLTNSSLGETSTACIDFSADKKILVADRYSLFNAEDGSKVNLESGFSVDATLTINGIESRVQLWCSFWGLWASGAKVNGTMIESGVILSLITNGITVTRMDYRKKQEVAYTLFTKTARLQKVTRRQFNLEQVKGLVLKINSPGKHEGVNIVWNGTDLIKVGQTQKQCLFISDYNSRPVSVTTDFTPTDWSDCGCLDTEGKSQPYSKRTIGPYAGQNQNNNNLPFYQTGEIRTVLDEGSQVLFKFTSADFSSGIQVSTNQGNMNGIINVEYVPLQIIHGMKRDIYSVGDTVTQEIDGVTATGEIYQATESFLHGFSCKEEIFEGYIDSNNLLHVLSNDASTIGQGMKLQYGYQYWGSIGEDLSEEDQVIYQVYGSGSFASLENPVNFTSSYCFSYFGMDWNAISTNHYCAGQTSYSSGVDKGALITQGDSVARTTTSYWAGQQEGIGYVMITGSGFNTNDEIIISSDGYGDWSNRGYHNIQGSLTVKKSQLEDQWSSAGPSVTFKLKENGVTTGCQQFELQSLPGTDGKIQVYGWTNGIWWTQVTDVGTTCTITNEQVYDISNELPQCDYEITYKCRVRIDNKSTRIIVKLPSKNANRFERVHDVLVNGNLASIYPEVEDAAGDAEPLTDSSILSYQTQTLIADDDVVPSLLCYDNCPSPVSSETANTIERKAYPSVLSKYIQITNGGKCDESYNKLSVNGYDVTFSGFVVSPKLNITWKESTSNVYNETTGQYTPTISYSISSVVLSDPGIGCDKDLIDASFNSTIHCTEVPALQLSCNTNGDFKDFRNAFHYHFDSTSGLLVDDQSGFTVEIGTGGSQSYFGNFFEDSDSNKEKLLCDWDKNQVCSWKSWQVLDEYYTYDTGPYSSKISLIDSNNRAFRFQQPIDLVATFSNNPVSASGRDYNEASVLLSYQGDGGLNGLPQVCLNQNMIPGQCDYDSTSYADINITPTQILRDLDGNRYYAKAAVMNEYYPIASDPSICSILTFADLPSEPDISIFESPENMNEAYPTEDTLKDYLNYGKPVVLSGQTTYELQQ